MTAKKRRRKLAQDKARRDRRQQPAVLPTTERLAQALEQAGAPADMIERARAGYYDDYKSELATPCVQLVADLRAAGPAFAGLVTRAIDGEFDATKAESAAWAASPDGQATFAELAGDPKARSMLGELGALLGMGTPTGAGPFATAMRGTPGDPAGPPKPATAPQWADQNPERDAALMIAMVDLADRTGGRQFEYGMANEDADSIEAAGWYCSISYQGTRVSAEDHRSMSNAAMDLAWKILHGSRCRCMRVVSLDPAGIMAHDAIGVDGSRWTAAEQQAAGVCVWQLTPVKFANADTPQPRWVGSCGAGRT